MRFLAFFFILLTLPLPASADCMDPRPVVDITEQWNFSQEQQLEFFLPTRNGYGGYITKTLAGFHWTNMERLEVSFTSHERGFSFPYTLYRMEIYVGDEFSHVDDFSQDCTEVGLSVRAGGSQTLPLIKIPASARAGVQPVRIRIWGKHN